MSDLEKRKLMAEFGGFDCVHLLDAKTEAEDLYGTIFIGDEEHNCHVPHYESDPAAACSLLPKLEEKLGHDVFTALLQALNSNDPSEWPELISIPIPSLMETAK